MATRSRRWRIWGDDGKRPICRHERFAPEAVEPPIKALAAKTRRAEAAAGGSRPPRLLARAAAWTDPDRRTDPDRGLRIDRGRPGRRAARAGSSPCPADLPEHRCALPVRGSAPPDASRAPHCGGLVRGLVAKGPGRAYAARPTAWIPSPDPSPAGLCNNAVPHPAEDRHGLCGALVNGNRPSVVRVQQPARGSPRRNG